jgi:putative transposase
MPRSSDYLLPGYTYHLTHRCHDRQFLLKFAQDRDVYREWLRVGVQRHRVPVYGFCITSSHVHVLAHVDSVESVSRFMHLASGSTAKRYNLRKGRTGSMWQHPYHCTMVEDGTHLLNCLTYINLNMVRAGAVAHPGEWRWCSHDELLGTRKRYRILNIERLCESLGGVSEKQLCRWYADAVKQRLVQGQMQRESIWTDSLAVGSEAFVKAASLQYTNRYTFNMGERQTLSGDAWTVREASEPYGAL